MNNINNSKPMCKNNRELEIENAFLIDITETASIQSIKHRVAVTKEVWQKYIEWTEEDNSRQIFQEQTDRLWEIIYIVEWVIKKTDSKIGASFCKVPLIPRDGYSQKTKLMKLIVLPVQGSDGKTVITVMLP